MTRFRPAAATLLRAGQLDQDPERDARLLVEPLVGRPQRVRRATGRPGHDVLT